LEESDSDSEFEFSSEDTDSIKLENYIENFNFQGIFDFEDSLFSIKKRMPKSL
jgi:hypothetical protein